MLADEVVELVGAHAHVRVDRGEPARVGDAGEGDAAAAAARQVAGALADVGGDLLGRGDPDQAALGIGVDGGERLAVGEQPLRDEEAGGQVLEIARRGLRRRDLASR